MKGQKIRSILALIVIMGGAMQLFAQSSNIVKEYKPVTYLSTFDLRELDDSMSNEQKQQPLMMLSKKCELPMFCAIEHNMEVKSRIPVRIRLGNLDYVNKLEGK